MEIVKSRIWYNVMTGGGSSGSPSPESIAKMVKAQKRNWLLKTKEEMKAHAEKSSKIIRNASKEQKDEWYALREIKNKNRCPSILRESIRKQKETWENKTPEEIKSHSIKSKSWNTLDKDEKDRRRLIFKGIMASMSGEERLKIAEKKRKSMLSKSEGEWNKIKRKRKNAWDNKSDKEKKEIVEKRASSLRGRKYPIVSCPHCGKSGGQSAMKRWHFNNCRELSL